MSLFMITEPIYKIEYYLHIMNIRNAIYYTPYEELEKKKVSFADYGQGKSYYNQLAPLFDALNTHLEHTPDEAKLLTYVMSHYYKSGPHSYLDIACGTGRHAGMLADWGNEVYGIDSSDSLLRLAQKYHKNVHFTKADMRNFNLKRQFDCLYCLWDSYTYLSSTDDMKQFRSCCYAHLKPGGILILDSKNFDKRGKLDALSVNTKKIGDLKVELIARKHAFNANRVYEAVFTSIISNLKTKQTHVVVDQSLARIYNLESLKKSFKNFSLVACYGDFNRSKYRPVISNRLITVFCKV